MLAHYALSTETNEKWKKWKSKIWGELFRHKKPERVRHRSDIFSEHIENKWYKFRVNVIRKIYFAYNRNHVITPRDKKLLVILRDYRYEMSVSESKLLKVVYEFEIA